MKAEGKMRKLCERQHYVMVGENLATIPNY